MQKQFNNGIDFVANGSSPAGWNLELDFDKKFVFTTQDGISITVYAVRPIVKDDVDYYEVSSVSGKLKIFIYHEKCTNNKQKVIVQFLDKEYTGCGQYLYNNLLNNTWILEQVGTELLDAKSFTKGLPTLSINLVNQTISGHDGCNAIHAAISVQGTRIHFAAIAQTKMFCHDNNPIFEQILGEKISGKVASYYLKNSKLILYLIDDSQLTFSPVK